MKIKTIVFFLTVFLAVNFQAQAQDSTAKLLKKAQIEAKKDGKSIFIKFEASWCGWCHKMTKDMKAESTKKIFDNNFVITDTISVAYNNWVTNPQTIRNTPVDTSSFMIGTDSVAIKFSYE